MAGGADDGPKTRDQRGLAAQAAAIIAGKPDPLKTRRPAQADPDPDPDEGDEGTDEDLQQQRGQAGEGPELDEEGEEGEEGDGDGSADPDGKPASLDDVAKRLGMTRQELNSIPVQIGAESMTLGELKAKLPELVKLDQSREELDDERGTWELERIGSYRNLQAIIDQLPKNPQTVGMLRQLDAQHERNRERELENLHFARPRWADPTYATGARAKMTAVAKEYGFTAVEVGSVMDHRQVLLLQDYAELREKVKASRDSARKVNEPDGSRNQGQGPARGGAAQPGNRPRTKDTQAQTAAKVGAIMRRR